MGSITSRPKVPTTNVTQPQYVYVPAAQTYTPASTASSATTSSSSSSGGQTTASTTATSDQESLLPSEVRIENLLRRGRGLGGTVLTGFRGLLSLNNNTPQRKTLLGE